MIGAFICSFLWSVFSKGSSRIVVIYNYIILRKRWLILTLLTIIILKWLLQWFKYNHSVLEWRIH